MADAVRGNAGPLEGALDAAPDLEGFLRRRGHGEGARDLVQDIFIVLLTRKDPPDASAAGRFRSFLFAIAYRVSANASRLRRRSQGECLEAHAPSLAAPAPTPEERALQRERVLRAAAALEALPADVRRTLLHVADEGLSTREVAERMNVSEEVVRARLSRGRRRLAAILEGKEDA